MTATWLDFEPIDVVLPRGNRLFGGGVHGRVTMPPWPSMFAGAVASRALADDGSLGGPGQVEGMETILERVLGPDYGLTWLGLEVKGKPCLPLPADLVVVPDPKKGEKSLFRLKPRTIGDSNRRVTSSSMLPKHPIMECPYRYKPLTGLWIDTRGLADYLAGRLPPIDTLITNDALWQIDPRLGIALDRDSGTAAEGDIYTTDSVVLAEGVKFLAGFSGSSLPNNSLVRLGGDGRGAKIASASEQVTTPLKQMGKPQAGWPGFRMILITPGIFPEGWLPPGVDSTTRRWEINGLVAELEAAIVNRHEVISGWDLLLESPKPARKMAPLGSVYWFRVPGG